MRFLAASWLALLALAGQAQTWPTQAVKIVVPFTPGTGMDTIARTLQPHLARSLGQAVVVQNTPGASGNIGADLVAKAAPDGHTVLLGANTMLIASQLYPKVPFDPLTDFAPVSMTAWGTLMLVANPKTGIKSMQDLIAQAKARPGRINYGSPGVGTPHHMAMELFKHQAGIFLLHVPYRGTAGYVQDLLGGEIMTGFLPVHVAQGFVRDGKLVPLAVGSAKRHPVAPGIATIDELGLKGVDVDMWYAVYVPAKTPAAVVTRLHDALDAALKQPDVRDVLSKAGLDAASSAPAELGNISKRDYTRWGNVIKRAGIKAE
jgi:tripartite-type tricarboxylate transporter receptor subunit TctC